MPLSVDTGHNLAAARGQVERLKKVVEEKKVGGKDLELNEGRRLAAEGRAAVARTKEIWLSLIHI